jgi:hypothetical protein
MNKLLTTGIILASLFSTAVAAETVEVIYSQDLSLKALSEMVYQRLPAKVGEEKYVALQQANDQLSQSLFAQPTTANLSHFNDAIGSSDGFQEWEGSVDLPLWLPGQKQQQQTLSQKIAAELPAFQTHLKLQASGEVRELIWQVKLAETWHLQSINTWKTAQKLEQDVISRVDAGDLPTTEKLLATSNSLEAHSNMLQAQSQLQQAIDTYSMISGQRELPAAFEEDIAETTTSLETHPDILLQNEVIARLKTEVGIAKYDAAVNPNLSVGVRRERGDFDESFNNSLGLGVSIALNDEKFSQPAIAEKNAELTDAQIARQTLLRELNRLLLSAQAELDSTKQQLKLIKQQNATTQQYYELQKRAFDLGEINLIDLLRSQVLANQNQSRQRELEILFKKQKAAVNQALGIIL